MRCLQKTAGLDRRLAADPGLGPLRQAYVDSGLDRIKLAARLNCAPDSICGVLSGRQKHGEIRKRLAALLLPPSKPEANPAPPMEQRPPTLIPFPTEPPTAPVPLAVSDAFVRSREMRDNLVASGLHLEVAAAEIGCSWEALIAVVCGHSEWGQLHDKVQTYLRYAVARREQARILRVDNEFRQAREQWNAVAGNQVTADGCQLRDETQLVA